MTKIAVPKLGCLPKSSKLTYDDYAIMSRAIDKRCELLDGDLATAPSPTEPHQDMARSLLVLLDRHVARHKLGRVYIAPFDVVLSPFTTLQPDLMFIAKPRLKIITEKNVQGAPDWVAEIVSESSRDLDYGIKMRLYFRHGVTEYWVVDPQAHRVEVYRRGRGAFRLDHHALGTGKVKSAAIEGFCVNAGALWSRK